MATRQSTEDRFRAKVKNTGSCHLWTAYRDRDGYGTFWAGKAMVLAHRWAYEQVHGLIPSHLEIDHLCRNPGCVRVSHLQAVSHAENVRRGECGQRAKTHCPQGHEYSPENTRMYRGGWRVCRACQRGNSLRYYAKNRDAISARRRERYRAAATHLSLSVPAGPRPPV